NGVLMKLPILNQFRRQASAETDKLSINVGAHGLRHAAKDAKRLQCNFPACPAPEEKHGQRVRLVGVRLQRPGYAILSYACSIGRHESTGNHRTDGHGVSLDQVARNTTPLPLPY